jgi:hypothetical protein
MPDSVRPGWGVLVATGDKSKAAAHFDRSLDRKTAVSGATLTGPDIAMTTTKTVVGRMLMNAEGTARAAAQVADILIDVPSGTSSYRFCVLIRDTLDNHHTPRLTTTGEAPSACRLTSSWHPFFLFPPKPNHCCSEREARRDFVRRERRGDP